VMRHKYCTRSSEHCETCDISLYEHRTTRRDGFRDKSHGFKTYYRLAQFKLGCFPVNLKSFILDMFRHFSADARFRIMMFNFC
jgi:hypothetical protein